MSKNEKKVIAIVAMTQDRVIGKEGKLPWHYSQDLQRFKRQTIGCVIIMGRKTWQSIGCKALPKRRNIVISSTAVENVECYSSVELALDNCDGLVWIIGGGQIYSTTLGFCDAIDITWIPEKIQGEGLIRFPEFNKAHWQAGERLINEQDSRLSHQLFNRIKHHIQ